MKKAGILFLILTLVFALRAQAQQWQATQLDMHSGLSDNCVNDVLMLGSGASGRGQVYAQPPLQ